MKDVTTDGPFNFSNIQDLKTLYAPAIKHCRSPAPSLIIHNNAMLSTAKERGNM